MIFEPFDVVITPFPYVDRPMVVARPGVVLTDWDAFGYATGIALVAMITSARHSSWPLDTPITDLAGAGLRVPCLVRMKLNSIDGTLIGQKIGHLDAVDIAAVHNALSRLLPFAPGT